MKLNHIVTAFILLIAFGIDTTKSEINRGDDDYVRFPKLRRKKTFRQSEDYNYDTNSENPSARGSSSDDQNSPSSNSNRDLSTAVNNEDPQDTHPYYDTQWEPNVFQKIRVPIGGPYCYAEKIDSHNEMATTQQIRYSPQLREESSEGNTPRSPKARKGVVYSLWPYEPGQDTKPKEIRKYLKLEISPERYDESYRLTGKASERAFISRYYGFVNNSLTRTIDSLINFIEDDKKTAHNYALDTTFNLLAEFNTWSETEKMEFCKLYINYSTLLLSHEIDFDPLFPKAIEVAKITVLYQHKLLKGYKEIVEVVTCPCVTPADDTHFILGVLPVRYLKPPPNFYAFIYDFDEETKNDEYFARVWALSKIDTEGLQKRRQKRDEEQRKKQEKRQKEAEKQQQKAEKLQQKEEKHKERNKIEKITKNDTEGKTGVLDFLNIFHKQK